MKHTCLAFIVILALSSTPAVASAQSNLATPAAADAVEDRDFVAQLYRDLLGRLPDAAGLATLVDLLDRGTTRNDVATFVLTSTEYRSRLVQSLYGALLNRPASSGEISAFLSAFIGGATVEDVIAVIVGSAEYFRLYDDSNTRFLNALFEDLLGRPIDPAALAVFENALASGASRRDVALAILGSNEYRTGLIGRLIIDFLSRPATTSETATLLALLNNGATDEQIIAILVGSDEYFADVATTLPDLCKVGGWRKFQDPTFRNQGHCTNTLGRLE